jgi:chaperonin GroEL
VKNPKDIIHGDDARSRILRGAQQLAKVVGVTYGPRGRTAMLDRGVGLLATKDGVTVAREINLPDPVENLGAQILKEACIAVNNDSGDGTTSTAILAAAILEEGHRLITAGTDPMQLAQGIEAAAHAAAIYVLELASPVETQELLERVAMIASNGDQEVSKKMAEACMAVGRDGTLTIEDGNSVGIELLYKEGMEIPRGAVSTSFLGGDSERVIEGPLVAVIGATLRTVEDVTSMMEVASQWPKNHLLVIAEGIEGDALKTMVMNDDQDVMKCVAVCTPGFHERKRDYLMDIAALTGADFVDPKQQMKHKEFDAEWFGSLRKATVRLKETILIAYDEATELIQERIAEIRVEMQSSRSEYDRDRCNERIAKLSGGLCVMEVGGFTETEMKERRARIEDALGSVRAALESGVLPGAGNSYLAASLELLRAISEDPNGWSAFSKDWQEGWRVFGRALQRPLVVLANNAGLRGDYTVEKAKDTMEDGGIWMGIDMEDGSLRDLNASPEIIDPLAVVQAVMMTAASVSKTLLTVEAAVVHA